jgi:hypothetical protein
VERRKASRDFCHRNRDYKYLRSEGLGGISRERNVRRLLRKSGAPQGSDCGARPNCPGDLSSSERDGIGLPRACDSPVPVDPIISLRVSPVSAVAFQKRNRSASRRPRARCVGWGLGGGGARGSRDKIASCGA